MSMSKYLLFRAVSVLLRLLILETKLVTNSAKKANKNGYCLGEYDFNLAVEIANYNNKGIPP